MDNILGRIRKMNWVLQESAKGNFSFNDLCEILSDLMDSNVYIVSLKGKVIGVHYKIVEDSPTVEDTETGIESFPEEYNAELLKVVDTRANLQGDEVLKIFKYDFDTSDKLHTVIPILGGGQRLGTVVMTRYDDLFTDEDLVLGEYGATVVGIEIQRQKNIEEEEENRRLNIVQMAIGTLSFSEVEAVQQIFSELAGTEGLLVASKIADRSGITRSVIVNALRKLESAGVIESRSLGMKGTYIKVLNDKFLTEIEKV